MKVGLFIPCYMEALFPKASMATFRLLEKVGVNIEYPMKQTCCGQPMGNTGCSKEVEPLAKMFYNNFKDYAYVIAPSGSCVSMVREQYKEYLPKDEYEAISKKTYEVCEFLTDVLKIDKLDSKFPHKVGVHNSCHGHRELKLASPSELNIPYYSKIKSLLSLVEGVEIVDLKRDDECCGFGGTFSVNEEAVSCFMGRDRIKDHVDAGAEFITGVDMSCLMHMQGLVDRDGNTIETKHITEILLGEEL